MADYELDRTDYELLAELSKDARISNKQLAGRVGLAPSTTHERLRRLSRAGVIRGFHADIAPEALGVGLEALLHVSVKHGAKAGLSKLKKHLETVTQARTVFHVNDDQDFIIHVAVRDAAELAELVGENLASRPEVERVRTQLVFSQERKYAPPPFATPES